MRVVLLATRHAARGRRVWREAAALAEAGHDVTVLSITTPGTDEPVSATYGVVDANPGSRWLRMLSRGPLRPLAQLVVSVRRIRRLEPAVVQACGPKPPLVGWLGARAAHALLVWDAAGLGVDRSRRRLLAGPLQTRLARASTAVIAGSSTLARELEARHRLALRPVVVRDVPELAQASAPARLRARLGLDQALVVVALGGELDGPRWEAMVRGSAGLRDAHVVVLGVNEGRQPDEIRLLGERLGMGTRLHLLREVPTERLPAYLDEADVVLGLAAPRDGREAAHELIFSLRAGIPVVAGATPEVEELAEDAPLAWMVDPTDAESVGKALRQACAASRAGHASRLGGTVASWEQEAAQLVALYDRLPSVASPGQLPAALGLSSSPLGKPVLAGLRSAVNRRSIRHPLALSAYVRGRARSASGDYAKASLLLERAWERDQRIPMYGLHLAAALKDARRPDHAIGVYTEVVAMHGRAPGSVAATAAINLARLGAREEAERLASMLEEAAGSDGRTWARVAEVRSALGDLDAAQSAITHALEIDPADRVVIATAARVLDQVGEPSRALEAAQSAGDSARVRRLTGVLRTLDPLWTPAAGEAPAGKQRRSERRVLHLLETSLPYAVSGYSHRTETVLRMQAQAGLEPVACTRLGFPASRGHHRHPFLESVGGVPHHRLGLRGVTRYTAVPPDELLDLNARLVVELAAARPPAVIQATTPHLNGLVGMAVRDAIGVPLVYDVRGFPEMTWAVRRGGQTTEVYARRREAETRCMVHADAVFTLSEVMKDQIVSRGVEPEKVSVVPHCVDMELFAPAPPRADLLRRYGLEDRVVVGYISSLLEYEGVDVLLKALAQLTGEASNVTGLIVGDGPMLQSLRALAERLGITDRVIFTGRVPFAEIRDHYALIDLFVCPRRDLEVCRYVTPLKPFEAMSMERCVVVSDLPALAELTAGGTAGVTFTPERADELAGVLGELCARPERMRELGRAARLRIEAHHSMAAMSSAVLAGFDSARGRGAIAAH